MNLKLAWIPRAVKHKGQQWCWQSQSHQQKGRRVGSNHIDSIAWVPWYKSPWDVTTVCFSPPPIPSSSHYDSRICQWQHCMQKLEYLEQQGFLMDLPLLKGWKKVSIGYSPLLSTPWTITQNQLYTKELKLPQLQWLHLPPLCLLWSLFLWTHIWQLPQVNLNRFYVHYTCLTAIFQTLIELADHLVSIAIILTAADKACSTSEVAKLVMKKTKTIKLEHTTTSLGQSSSRNYYSHTT